MDDPWTIAPARAAGTHDVTLRAGPRPLVARLTDAELASAEAAMASVAGAVRRGEFSRIQLGTAFREAIGRDPFRQQKPPAKPDTWRWVFSVASLVMLLGFVSDSHDHALWVRIVTYVLAAAVLADLIVSGVRRLRSGRKGD